MFQQIIDKVKEFDSACRMRASVPWFRGHEDAKFLLRPTLHRLVDDTLSNLNLPTPLPLNEQVELLYGHERSKYQDFKMSAWPLLKPRERSEWGMLYAMQHYGLPTRLLDWTESFACALFFAAHNPNPNQTSAIWMLDPQELNSIAIGKRTSILLQTTKHGKDEFRSSLWHPEWVLKGDHVTDLPSFAGTPINTNPRMTAQQSVFTVMGNSLAPLDAQFDGQLIAGGFLQKVELDPSMLEDIETYLRLAGISAFTYFPDLDGLARRHRERTAAELRLARKYYPHLVKP